MKTRRERICVFCGSSSGTRPEYVEAAREMGEAIAASGRILVYGGGNMGCMGELARAARSGGARVEGIIPARLNGLVDHTELDSLEVTADMHSRKALMYEKSDAFIALPGGIGTLDEFFEVWTWQQLGYHAKPVALCNVAGYFNSLLGLLEGMVSDGFVKPAHRNSLVLGNSPRDILDQLDVWTASTEAKLPERR